MLGASFFLGGLNHHIQEYNRATARLDAALLFLAAIALVSPSAIAKADLVSGAALTPFGSRCFGGAFQQVVSRRQSKFPRGRLITF
jgi:Ca2+/H+ antiporter